MASVRNHADLIKAAWIEKNNKLNANLDLLKRAGIDNKFLAEQSDTLQTSINIYTPGYGSGYAYTAINNIFDSSAQLTKKLLGWCNKLAKVEGRIDTLDQQHHESLQKKIGKIKQDMTDYKGTFDAANEIEKELGDLENTVLRISVMTRNKNLNAHNANRSKNLGDSTHSINDEIKSPKEPCCFTLFSCCLGRKPEDPEKTPLLKASYTSSG